MQILMHPFTAMGRYIRDNAIIPDPNGKFKPEVFQECEDVLNPEIPDPVFYPNKQKIFELFKKRKEEVEHFLGNKKIKTTALIFETNFPNATEMHTCVRVGGGDELLSLSPIRIMPLLSAIYRESDRRKNLRIIQVSLFDHQEELNGQWKAWKPDHFEEMGGITFSFLESLQKTQKITIDSMICHSMGSAVLESLKSIDSEKVPKTLILDRAMPSVWKVGSQILNPITCYVLYFMAWCSGWNGNPEQSLVQFFERIKNTPQPQSLSNRNIVILEAEHDFYFSGSGAFDKDFESRLEQAGANVSRNQLTSNGVRLHGRAHHACPLDFLVHHGPIMTQGNFSINSRQSAASAITQNIFNSRLKSD